MPFTDAFETNSLQVESSPGSADFAPITCGNGSVFRFFGNGCEHLTELNLTGATRLSLDFRVIRAQELHLQPVAGASEGGARGGAVREGAHATAVAAGVRAVRAGAMGSEGGVGGTGKEGGIGAGEGKGACEYFRVGRYYKRLVLSETDSE